VSAEGGQPQLPSLLWGGRGLHLLMIEVVGVLVEEEVPVQDVLVVHTISVEPPWRGRLYVEVAEELVLAQPSLGIGTEQHVLEGVLQGGGEGMHLRVVGRERLVKLPQERSLALVAIGILKAKGLRRGRTRHRRVAAVKAATW